VSRPGRQEEPRVGDDRLGRSSVARRTARSALNRQSARRRAGGGGDRRRCGSAIASERSSIRSFFGGLEQGWAPGREAEVGTTVSPRGRRPWRLDTDRRSTP
jgi:hypothetical protein